MKNKLFLPGMAMVFAIGLSFATERSTADPNMDYYLDGEEYIPIGRELTECGEQSDICQVRLVDGTVHEVYDAKFDDFPKAGSGQIFDQ